MFSKTQDRSWRFRGSWGTRFPCFSRFVISMVSALRSAGSDYSPRRSEAELFCIEFSDLHVSEENPIKPRSRQFESQFFKAEYLADEDSVFVPAYVAAIVHTSEKKILWVGVLRHFAWQPDGTGEVETRRRLVVQALMRPFVVEYMTKAI